MFNVTAMEQDTSGGAESQNARPPRRRGEKAARVALVIYYLYTYLAAFLFSSERGDPDYDKWFTVLWVCGLVMFIMAAAALQIMHYQDRCSPGRHLALVLFPFLLYLVATGGWDFWSRQFWQFAGYAYFIVITGGFLLGMLLAPVLAMAHGAGAERSRRLAGLGVEWWRQRGKLASGVALFAVSIAALGFGAWMQCAALDLDTPGAALAVVAFQLAAVLLVAHMTWRHTIFAGLAAAPQRGGA